MWRGWWTCSAKCGGCCAMMGRCFSISEIPTLPDPFGVQPLMALPTKHLKVFKSVVVFAKVFVMRVYRVIALAYLATVPRSLPRLTFPSPRPAASIRYLRAAILPHRIACPRLATTKPPLLILCHLLTSQARSLAALGRPRSPDFLSYARQAPPCRASLRNACRADAHCKIALRRPFVWWGATATQGCARRLLAIRTWVLFLRHTHI